MRIALDCRSVFKGMGGIGRYAWSLLNEFAAIDTENTYVCYFTHLSPPEPVSLPPRFGLRIFEAGMIDERFDQMILPTLLAEDRIDVYHNPTFAVPVVGSGTRTVATIHDVVFKRHPELVEPKLARYLDNATRRACRRADRLVTVSQFSRDELVSLYDVDPERISVIPNGVHAPRVAAQPDGRVTEEVRQMGLTSRSYVLYVGSIESKKNIDVLLLAFREASARLKDASLKLALAGSHNPEAYPVRSRVRELGMNDRVVIPGHVSETVLESLYAGALVFVYPSLYEGFGLPPLEAMARGVPTIVSKAGSLPEVVGDCALLFDPAKPADLAQFLVDLVEDPARREDLSRRGKRRAGQFSWKRSAREHLKVYEAAMRAHEGIASGV